VEVAAGGKVTAALRDGVVGGGVMDGGIGMGSGEMRMVAAARTTESSGMVRGVGSGRQRRCGQRRRRCGVAPLVVGVDAKLALRQAHSKPKGAGLTRAMNPESVPVNFPGIDKGNKIVR
jgi:hypothetical protein